MANETQKERRLLLGNAAIARGAWEAGVGLSSAYPGTPSTEISEEIILYPEIYAEWAPNEKVALEVAFGASVQGVRALASMKHVGLNVAADPLYTASYTGVNGGLVIVVADDPGLYSSQNEQDTRAVARAAHLPVLEPSNSQEAKDFMKLAYELSEAFDTPVIVRTTTRLSHSQTMVELGEREELPPKPFENNAGKYVMTPANAMRRRPWVIEKMAKLSETDFPGLNQVEMRDQELGIICSGMVYNYVREALPKASILKLGQVYPLPMTLIQDFIASVDAFAVLEELDPLVERDLRAMGYVPKFGKADFSEIGEYSANMLKRVILGETQEFAVQPAEGLPARPPILCPGCPHRATFQVMKKLKLKAAGDIGCYTLGAAKPLELIETTLCMGASISAMHGMEKALSREETRDWVAVIGDSTFMHTGINSLMNMVYNRSKATVLILDNSTTAMTGHQDNPSTGRRLMAGKTDEPQPIDIASVCRGLGIQDVKNIHCFELEEMEQAFKDAKASDDLSVIIAEGPCALLGIHIRHQYKVNHETCRKCGLCLKSGCPALSRTEEGYAFIDDTLCNGCGLCYRTCPFDAIEMVDSVIDKI